MAYLYRHIRLDTNEVFYVGIGSDHAGKYSRSSSKQNRNKFWHNIVAKTNYDIEVFIDNLTWDEACAKEIEFIAIYGRRSEGGTLVNLSLGGEGILGVPITEEQRRKQSLAKKGKPSWNKGIPLPEHRREVWNKINVGRPSWNKGRQWTEEERAVMKVAQQERFKKNPIGPRRGKKMSEETRAKTKFFPKGNVPWNKGIPADTEFLKKCQQSQECKAVLQYDLSGNFIKEHASIRDAAKEIGITAANMSNCVHHRRNQRTYKGYVWIFKTEKPAE